MFQSFPELLKNKVIDYPFIVIDYQLLELENNGYKQLVFNPKHYQRLFHHLSYKYELRLKLLNREVKRRTQENTLIHIFHPSIIKIII